MPQIPTMARPLNRKHIDRVLFLGPATILLVLFFMVPVIVDIGLAFTDMGRNLRVTGFTTENVQRMLGGDRRLSQVMLVTLTYVLCTLAIFNVGYGLLLALLTTALPDRAGSFFRAVWFLPRMSPSVVCALLWSWVVAPTERKPWILAKFFSPIPLTAITSSTDLKAPFFCRCSMAA